MEPLHERQIEALRKVSGISTFYVFLDMSDFALNLATKGGRRDEMEKLARVVYGTTRKLQQRPSQTGKGFRAMGCLRAK